MRHALIVACLVAASPAVAVEVNVSCMPWARAKELFELRHERPVSRGQVDADSILVITAAPGGATWSLLAVRTDGKTCVLAWGTGYDAGAVPPAGEQG